MNACMFGFARKSIAMPQLPLFTLTCTSKDCTSPKVGSGTLPEHCGMSPAKRDGHRLWKSGHRPVVRLSANDAWPAGTECGRSAISSCRTLFDSSRGPTRHGNAFLKQMFAQPPSPSCYGLKGVWPSVLGPPITHLNA